MQKTKIEWTDYTWNPIKGICPVGCWYCYARRIYRRFELDPDLRIKEIRYCPQKPSKIFVCSTIELFHPAIPKKWRDTIFKFIEDCPQHTFQILTKFPQNIDRPMPDNVWLGVTVTNIDDFWKARRLGQIPSAKIKFISFEPLLSKIWSEHCYVEGQFKTPLWVDWVIVGRLTGQGRKHDPLKDWIKHIVKTCYYSKTPIFLKNNLKEIWGEPLIQEMPEEKS